MVYRFVSMRLGRGHADLDDVVQETLISAARSIGSLRAERDGAVPAWFLTIARHKVADHLRARYSRPSDSLDGPVGAKISDPAPAVDEQVMAIARGDQLREAMRLLTPEQEEVLTLRFVLGFGIDEVAEITRRPAGAVKSMQHRALASLQQKLGTEQTAWN